MYFSRTNGLCSRAGQACKDNPGPGHKGVRLKDGQGWGVKSKPPFRWGSQTTLNRDWLSSCKSRAAQIRNQKKGIEYAATQQSIALLDTNWCHLKVQNNVLTVDHQTNPRKYDTVLGTYSVWCILLCMLSILSFCPITNYPRKLCLY